MTTIQAPELRGGGFRGGYRIYTIEHLPRHAFPTYASGGPATVALPGWSVSYLSGTGIDGVKLQARRSDGSIGAGRFHELSGKTYADREAATTAAYEAGLIGIMLYEDAAIRDGLGIAA